MVREEWLGTVHERRAADRRGPHRGDGRGYCADIVPELVTLDDWGYPIVLRGVPDELLRSAEDAVAICPKMALRLARLARR